MKGGHTSALDTEQRRQKIRSRQATQEHIAAGISIHLLFQDEHLITRSTPDDLLSCLKSVWIVFCQDRCAETQMESKIELWMDSRIESRMESRMEEFVKKLFWPGLTLLISRHLLC